MRNYFLRAGLCAALLLALPASPALAAAEAARQAPSCSVCNMAIDESARRFSVIDTKSNDKVAFDDIGCALLWRQEQCASKELSFNSNAAVFDYYSGEPVAIEDAVFVVDSGAKTPMGYGIIAFKDKQSAERFIKETGKGKAVAYGTLPVPKK